MSQSQGLCADSQLGLWKLVLRILTQQSSRKQFEAIAYKNKYI